MLTAELVTLAYTRLAARNPAQMVALMAGGTARWAISRVAVSVEYPAYSAGTAIEFAGYAEVSISRVLEFAGYGSLAWG